ncbi:SPOR domain-containing protein [Photobacterium sp. J15]|uniref:SPOR domain-containing protein n=1 Tax=Photobacterium sp. J15 TaxID=265901 RepID=UPI000AFF3957|nr:SPOR domain-containing protein [Photobacterium sp. J15]
MICPKNKQRLWGLLSVIAMLSSSNAIASEQYTAQCQIERTDSGWQFLNPQCDIGKGLWGRKPDERESSFWLQCNYSKSLPSKNLTKAINRLFPHNSYLVPDGDKYRCLIGPFDDQRLAEEAQNQLTRFNFDKAFIRQTANKITVTGKAGLITPLPAKILKPRQPEVIAKAEPKKQAEPPIQKTQPKANPTAQTPKPVKQEAETDKRSVLVENRVILNSSIYSFTFNNLKYHLPMTINSTEEMPPMFVREQNIYWSKVNFTTAESWCKRFGLRLPTIAELQYLHTHGQHYLLRHRWPIKANYWSNTLNTYSGEIRTLNIRSGRPDDYRPLALLYATCVVEAS